MKRWWHYWVLAGLLVVLMATGAASQANKGGKIPVQGLHRKNPQASAHSVVDLRRRLEDLDRQLLLRNVGKAEDLLNDLSQHSILLRELVTREIRLYQIQGNHEKAVKLCRETLLEQSLNPSLWRYLAVSELALQHLDESRDAIGHYIATNANTRSAGVVGVDLFRMAGYQEIAVALIDTMRLVLKEPRFLGRSRAVGLLGMGKESDAAQEVSLELRSNPYNLSLLRTELLDGVYLPDRHTKFLQVCRKKSLEPGRKAAEVLLVVNLELAGGNDQEALALVRSLLTTPSTAVTVLSNITPMVRELDLLDDTQERIAMSRYLLGVLESMVTDHSISFNLRKRSTRYLALVTVMALESGYLRTDHGEAVDTANRYLAMVQAVNPTSEQLYSSQIRVIKYMRDHLGEPVVAARRLESMLMDLNLPNDGVAMVRLSLGECYMAAGDTARGRMVLTSLGRDPDFHTAGGHAHFYLARLDLAEGHFVTARDRFAVVAMDNPAASYANEALELGLAIAEEMENPSGGPAVLTLYARSIYFDLTSQPEKRRIALEHFVRYCSATLDLEDDQHLLERGRMELAELLAGAGEYSAAIEELKQIYTLHPRGRYPAESLAMQGELYVIIGKNDQANAVWQQLLVQYPGYLFIDDVRDQLRSLP